MTKKRIFFLVSGLVIGVAVVGAAAWGTAAHLTSAQEADEGADAVNAAELEAFRGKLVEYYGDLLELEPYVAEFAAPGLGERIVKAQELVAELPAEQLVELEEVFSGFPTALDHPGQLLSEQAFLRDFQQAGERYAQAQRGLPEGLSEGPEYVGSGPNSGCLSLDTNILYGLRVPLEAANIFMEMVPGDLVAACFTTWAHPAKIAAVVIKEVYQAIVFGFEWAAAVGDSCEQGFHQELVNTAVYNYLDETVSSRASQETLDALYNYVLDICPEPGASQAPPENQATVAKVDLEVTQLRGTGKFLITATDAGRPLTGVEFISVRVAPESASFIDVTADTTVSAVGDGMYLATITPKTYGRWNTGLATLVTFEVKHNNGFEDHYGLALFHGNSLWGW